MPRSQDTVASVGRNGFMNGKTQRARVRITTECQARCLHFLTFRDCFSTPSSIAYQWFTNIARELESESSIFELECLVFFRSYWVLPLNPDLDDSENDYYRTKNGIQYSWGTSFDSVQWYVITGPGFKGDIVKGEVFVKSHVHHIVDVMIWGAITYNSRSPLVFLKPNMTAHRYGQEIVEHYHIPYLRTNQIQFFLW